MLWSMLLFIITISILVTVHEFGHFLVARLCGVKVECFSIGFGKKLWSHRFSSGTELVIAMIPLGGYVRMLDGRTKQLTSEEQKYAFNLKKIWQRSAIVAAGPIANFLLAWIVYWVIFQCGVVMYPVKIERTLPNTPAAMAEIPAGAELKKINHTPIENWNDVNTALLAVMGEKSVTIAYTIDTTHEKSHEINQTLDISHWQFDLEKESAITTIGFVPKNLDIYPIVSKIVPGSAAEKAGLKIGDEIIRYNNQSYSTWNDFVARIKQAGTITLVIKRDDKLVDLDLIPTVQANGEGIAGLYPTSDAVIKQYGFVDAFGRGFGQTESTIRLTVRSLYQLVTGVIGLKNLSGPITIAKSAGQTASYGIVSYLYFLAFISISLGVINLVPLPMLDGGHLFFLCLEKIKGRALSETTQAICYRLGFVLLMIIMGIALFNDFLRL
ncbi:RIP metalloprotease RseP [Orbaceae bacterium ESL0727]|nr:RIP metalloprotease RseP [Orbaceae bacterium ESL0727]